MIKILEHINQTEFDALAPHPLQSFAWGEVRKATGLRVVRFGEYVEDKLAAVHQMTVHKLPKLSYYIGYMPRSTMPSMELLDFLHTWGKKEKIIFIKFEPDVPAEKFPRGLTSGKLRRSLHPLFAEWTQVIDLELAPEEIYKRFRKTTRYSIRHAEQLGVTAKEMSTDEGFAIFSDLYASTAERQGYHGHNSHYRKTVWRILHPAGVARIFVSFYQDKPKAAFLIFFWHNKAYYVYSGSTAEDRSVPATQHLMWHVIEEAKKSGAKTLDLWGSLPPDHKDKNHPWYGFTLFKSGFGARYVHMAPSLDLVIFPFLYRLYGVAYRLRSLFWKGGLG